MFLLVLAAVVTFLLFVYLLVALLRRNGSNSERHFLMWLLPLLIVLVCVALSIPIGLYMAWIMDGRYRAPGWLHWFEQRLDTGPQNWKQYTVALLLFNTVMFVFGFLLLSLQPYVPFLNPDNKGMLAPTTIFNTVTSFLTNTNLQDYSGEVHLSYFSQLVFITWNMFVSASVGFCALSAMIRALRSDSHMGNFYTDMWRVVVYIYVPAALIMGVILLASGVPMTLDGTRKPKPSRKGPWAKTLRAIRSRRSSPAARWPGSFPSNTWGPTAAGSSGPTRRTPSRIPRL